MKGRSCCCIDCVSRGERFESLPVMTLIAYCVVRLMLLQSESLGTLIEVNSLGRGVRNRSSRQMMVQMRMTQGFCS